MCVCVPRETQRREREIFMNSIRSIDRDLYRATRQLPSSCFFALSLSLFFFLSAWSRLSTRSPRYAWWNVAKCNCSNDFDFNYRTSAPDCHKPAGNFTKLGNTLNLCVSCRGQLPWMNAANVVSKMPLKRNNIFRGLFLEDVEQSEVELRDKSLEGEREKKSYFWSSKWETDTKPIPVPKIERRRKRSINADRQIARETILFDGQPTTVYLYTL